MVVDQTTEGSALAPVGRGQEKTGHRRILVATDQAGPVVVRGGLAAAQAAVALVQDRPAGARVWAGSSILMSRSSSSRPAGTWARPAVA